jgi:hypothetical protein
VATQHFSFNTFRFHIWDYFNGFNSSITNELLILVTVYDPIYFMPMKTAITVKINFPPYGGKITVTPNIGDALSTVFSIALSGYEDEELPLSYSYSYYLS